jgi:hypothetical protein
MSRLHIGSTEKVTIESSPTRTLLIFQQNADPWMRGQRKAIPLQGPGPLLKREHQAEKRHRANFGECLLLEVEPSFRLSCGAAVDRPTFEVRSYMPSLIQINAYFNEALRIANA